METLHLKKIEDETLTLTTDNYRTLVELELNHRSIWDRTGRFRFFALQNRKKDIPNYSTSRSQFSLAVR